MYMVVIMRHLEHESDFQVTGYPSKPIGLYSKQSIIFRSDSNAEDLEGYAGAGLYDRFVLNLNFVVRCTTKSTLFHLLYSTTRRESIRN